MTAEWQEQHNEAAQARLRAIEARCGELERRARLLADLETETPPTAIEEMRARLAYLKWLPDPNHSAWDERERLERWIAELEVALGVSGD